MPEKPANLDHLARNLCGAGIMKDQNYLKMINHDRWYELKFNRLHYWNLFHSRNFRSSVITGNSCRLEKVTSPMVCWSAGWECVNVLTALGSARVQMNLKKMMYSSGIRASDNHQDIFRVVWGYAETISKYRMGLNLVSGSRYGIFMQTLSFAAGRRWILHRNSPSFRSIPVYVEHDNGRRSLCSPGECCMQRSGEWMWEKDPIYTS